MEESEASILHTYNRFPVVFDHGEGVHLYDSEGKKYLDFAAGIAVNSLGYHYPGYDEALKEQIDRLTHISNLYYNEPMTEAGAKLVNASRMDKAFFTNSGTEAIEGALKAAKKYAYIRDGHADHEIIAMNHSFHGRSIGALSVTGNAHYREPFEPLMGGVKFADFNDLDSVKAQITDKTCAIIMETVQGEGGIYPAEREFLEGVRALCDEKNIILVKEVRQGESYGELDKTANTILDMMNTEAMTKVRVSYGTVINDIKEVSRSYKEAKMALDVGRIFYANKNVIAYSNLGIGRLIYQLPIPLCKMFIREVFDGKSPDEFDEETLATINKFFENSLNVSETSRQLYIHRNTLVYRLDKLQKSTGLDLRVFEDAITFKIALMVAKYMKYMESLDY